MEHNMVASSRIYDNVSFKELGMLLQIPCQQVGVRVENGAVSLQSAVSICLCPVRARILCCCSAAAAAAAYCFPVLSHLLSLNCF